MSLFSEIEKTIERGFQRWTERMFGAADSNELLLVQRAILLEIESKIQTVARGKRVFPFPLVTVTFVSPDAERRTLYETAFAADGEGETQASEGGRLQNDIREALEGAGCQLPPGFAVAVETAETGKPPFEIAYSAKARKKAPEVQSTGRLLVVKGKAERAEYALDKARTNIGRLPELTDAEQRVVRRNDVVFEEGDDSSGTVSRKHAHIRLEAGDYRLCDDGSEFGTRVFRDGRPIEVPPGNRRGEKLRAGDEIYLGRACLRFERA